VVCKETAQRDAQVKVNRVHNHRRRSTEYTMFKHRGKGTLDVSVERFHDYNEQAGTFATRGRLPVFMKLNRYHKFK